MGSKGQNSTSSEHGHVAYQIKENNECSNMVANILSADPPPPYPGDGVSRSKLNFTEHAHVAYQIKENHECSNMVANKLPTTPPPPLPQNSTFSEHGHVACQVKQLNRITKCSNMVAKVLPAEPPPSPPPPSPKKSKRSKFNFFRTWSCCKSNLLESWNAAMQQTFFPADPLPHPLLKKGSQVKILLFSEHGHAAYQINQSHEMQQHGSNCFNCRTPSPTTLGDGVRIQFFQNMVMLQIKFIGITNMEPNILPLDPPSPLTLGV